MARSSRSTLAVLTALVAACGGATPLADDPPLAGESLPPAPAPAITVLPAGGGGDRDAPFDPAQKDPRLFRLADVFELEWASDPQIAPDASRVAYVRTAMDITTDRARRSVWVVDTDGGSHHPAVTGGGDFFAPRWSPSGDRLAYVGVEDGDVELYVRWMKSGETARITTLAHPPSNIAWSPDGTRLAFTMLVAAEAEPLVALPRAPEGATWAEPPRVIDRVTFRVDGEGYLEDGFAHVFVVPADGGTPRQLTSGDFHHDDSAPAWSPDTGSIVIAANRREDWERAPLDTELYEIDLAAGELRQLTDRRGPDEDPAVSPSGDRIAYVGFDDEGKGHHTARLYVLERATGEITALASDLDRSVGAPRWRPDGRGVYVSYADHGDTKIAFVPVPGETERKRGAERRVVAEHIGGESISRPYGGGELTVARDGSVAFTVTDPHRPADVAVVRGGRGETHRLTGLNDDLLDHKTLGEVTEIRVESSHDQREIQAWVVTPPGFDAEKKYPLVLEIHGGPFADYGPRFAAEMQLYAAAGYVVVYANPRGSTSYGDEFANLIHHTYPGHDYDDLMSVVDAVIARGHVDPERLFVTGGSGGGVLTAWIVGSTDRFRAAVVAKPVINWASFVLTADFPAYFTRYWFPGMPWEEPEHYFERSPISRAGKIDTPTMVLTGEADLRTPISESEQLYTALELRGVDTVLVRIPGASHSIAARPSQLIAKVSYVLAWFHRHG